MSIFFKRTFPMLVAFGVGFFFAVQYYIPASWSQEIQADVSNWYKIIAAFVILLGVISVCQVHGRKIRRLNPGWGYSGILFVAAILTLFFGFLSEGKTVLPAGTENAPAYGSSLGWFYNSLLLPLGATMFATLAFYVASAAFRTFRAKNIDSFLLLFFAVVMLFATATLGNYIWDSTLGTLQIAGWKVPYLGEIQAWILDFLNMPVRRAILIGVALGVIATSLKIIFGIERTYMGGRGE